MGQNKILVEGISEINANLETAAEQIDSLLGGESGTSYAVSYNSVSSNADVVAVLDSIVKRVEFWPSAVRYTNKDYQPRRVVILVSSVIPQMATRLYEYAMKFLGKNTGVAINWFRRFNAMVNNDINHNEFAGVGNRFYKACIDSIAYNTKVRRGTGLDEDLSASDEYVQVMGKLGDIYKPIRQLVVDIVKAMKLENRVSAEAVDDATKLVFAYNTISNYIYGTDLADRAKYPWYDPEDPADKKLYKYIVHMSAPVGASKEASLSTVLGTEDQSGSGETADNSDVASYIARKETKELEKARRAEKRKAAKALDKTITAETGTEAGDTSATGDMMLVKDMDHLGENTNQMNYVGEGTKFACAYYYPIFAVDGLSQYTGTEYEKPIQRLATLILREVGFSKVSANMEFSQFAEMVNGLFKVVSQNTENAIAVHTNICEAFQQMKDEDFDGLAAAIAGVSEINKKAKALADETIAAFFRNVVYMGSFRLNGRTTIGGEVSGRYLLQPVSSFGESSYNDRNETMGLTASGKAVSSLFRAGEDSVELSYDDSGLVTDAGIGSRQSVDTIPFNVIRDIHKDYVSSCLVPIIASRKGMSWVVLKGIVAFSKANLGTMDDTRVSSDYAGKVSDLYRGAHQETRADVSSKLSRSLSNPTFVRNLVDNKFVPADAIDNTGTKLDISKAIYDRYKDTDIDAGLTALRNVCDTFTKGITSFAEHVSEKSTVATKSGVLNHVYKAAPDINTLISMYTQMGGDVSTTSVIERCSSEIDKYILRYVKSFPTGDGKASASEETIDTERDAAFVAVYDALKDIKSDATPNQVLKTLAQYVVTAGKLATKVPSIVPEGFNDIYKEVLGIYENSITAANKAGGSAANMYKAMETVSSKHMDTMFAVIGKLISADTDAAVNQLRAGIKASVDTELSEAKDSISVVYSDFVSDDCIKLLRDGIVDTIVAIKENDLTAEKLAEIQKAIATTMSGDKGVNYAELRKMSPNQLVMPVKTMKTLYGIGKTAETGEDSSDMEASVADIEVSDSSPEAMPELDPLDPSNKRNIALHAVDAADDALVTGASTDYEMLEHASDGIDAVIGAYGKYASEVKRRDEIMAKLSRIFEFVKRMVSEETGESFDEFDMTKSAWVRAASRTGLFAGNILNKAEKYIADLAACNSDIAARKDTLTEYKDSGDMYSGLVSAMLDGKVSVSDVESVQKTIDAATSVLNDLHKYSVSAGDTKSRLYAYTENDFTAISQLIYIIGSHLCIQNDDTEEDVLEVLASVKGVLERYSGNPLSVKIADAAIKKLSAAKDDEEFAVAEVEFIRDAGNILQANTGDRNKELVGRTGTIALPSVNKNDPNAMDMGAGLDAYARTMFRKRANTDASKAVGRANKEEKAARQAYIDIVRDDMSRHPELAKYAFALGSLLDAFERTADDERIDEGAREERKYNSIKESMAEVSLEGNLGDNDLQRELLSAIMDDERKGDKTYPTVKQVVEAAHAGQPINAYSLEYKSKVGSRENIVKNARDLGIMFDDNGNRSKTGTPLSYEEIGKLAVGSEHISFSFSNPGNVADLVKAVRMAVCKKIAARIGEMDEEGNVKLKPTQNALAETALRSLYKMCADLDTPISSIMVANSNLGYKLGRDVSVAYAKKTLSSEGDLDFDTVSRVAGEADAFPVNYSDELSEADMEWIDDVTSLLGAIPDELSESDVRNAVNLYCGSRVDRSELASDKKLMPMYSIISRLTKLDTATGVPMGFWGNDMTKVNATIRSIFNLLLDSKMGDRSWKERAEVLRERFIKARATGATQLALYGQYEPKRAVKSVTPSETTSKQIAHRRVNPYYSVPMHRIDSDEYMAVIKALVRDGYITKLGGNTVSLKYPGLKFDKNTFAYLVMMSIGITKPEAGSGSEAKDIETAFDTALMCYITGVRLDKYRQLSERVAGMATDSDEAAKAVTAAGDLLDADIYGDMVKTTTGWFTEDAFTIICLAAMGDDEGLVAGLDKVIASLTGGSSTRGTDLSQVTKAPSSDTFKPEEKVVEKPKPPKKKKPSVKPVEPAEVPSTDDDDDFKPEVHPAEQAETSSKKTTEPANKKARKARSRMNTAVGNPPIVSKFENPEYNAIFDFLRPQEETTPETV